jgi:hypothetical protein
MLDDRYVDLLAEGIDVAIRIDHLIACFGGTPPWDLSPMERAAL